MQDYTAREVSILLKVAEGTVWRWLRQGKLKGCRLGGTGTYRVSQQALDEFKAGR